jgi:hypothetical protein
MNRLFEGRIEFAGNSKSGIRRPIAEQLARGGCLVFGWYRDHDELANELQHVATATSIFDFSRLLNELGVSKYAPLGESSSVVRVSRSVLSFERWFVGPGSRTVFLARESEVEVPQELMDDALAVLTNLAVSRIERAPQPAVPFAARRHPFSELASLAAFLIEPVR